MKLLAVTDITHFWLDLSEIIHVGHHVQLHVGHHNVVSTVLEMLAHLKIQFYRRSPISPKPVEKRVAFSNVASWIGTSQSLK